jgi:Kdo2-lipid IVA lauroyltransferase/acyltransferase
MSEFFVRLGLRVFRGLAHLPYPVLRAIARLIAPILYLLAVPRRRVALRNLEACWPQKDLASRKRMAKAHFRAFTQSFLDRFIFWYGSPEVIRARCQVQGLEHLQQALGQPLLLLSPHFVGMDAGGLRVQLETRVFGMYARQNSAALNEVMTKGRERFNGTEMLLRTDGIRGALKRLKVGIPFYFCPDMDLGAKDALFVPFFGVPAATVTTLHGLAKITGAKVLPCITEMTPQGYVMHFEPVWDNFPSDDVRADTERMNRYIESAVQRFPEQYLWTHRRFKTRPMGEASFYAAKR